MSQSWPPPPDLESIQQLVREADIEGHLAEGAPADEYEPEEEAIFTALAPLPTAELTATNVLPVLEAIWRQSFALSDAQLAQRSAGLEALAVQIERFFGPEAQPLVRQGEPR